MECLFRRDRIFVMFDFGLGFLVRYLQSNEPLRLKNKEHIDYPSQSQLVTLKTIIPTTLDQYSRHESFSLDCCNCFHMHQLEEVGYRSRVRQQQSSAYSSNVHIVDDPSTFIYTGSRRRRRSSYSMGTLQ